MTRTATLSAEIRELQHRLEVWYPAELAATTHARRIASLRRQRDEDQRQLEAAVTELGSAVQEAGR